MKKDELVGKVDELKDRAKQAEGPAEIQDEEIEDDGGEDIDIDPEIEEADDE